MPRRRSNRQHRPVDAGETTLYEKAAVLLVTAIPMLAMVGYGAVDVWSLIPLSVLTIILLVLWTADTVKRRALRFSTSWLQVPVAALIVIGCIQLLPLCDAVVSAELLAEPASASLSLDPFATRIFTIRVFLLLIFFAAALTFMNGKRRVQRVVTSVIIFGALMAFIGILQRLTSPDSIYGLRPTPQAIPLYSIRGSTNL